MAREEAPSDHGDSSLQVPETICKETATGADMPSRSRGYAIANSDMIAAMYLAPSIRWSTRMFSFGEWVMEVT